MSFAGTRSRPVRRFVIAAVTALALVGGLTVAIAEPASAAPASGWLHTSGSTIKTAKNKAYVIKAVNWFGMELAACAPHGLWQISLDQGMAEIKSMGFNTVRIPFSNECLAAQSTSTVNSLLNPDLFGKTGIQVLDAVVDRAAAYGLNVILDRHRPSSSAQTALWYTAAYPESRWISDWQMLAKRYKSKSNVIGFDLHNEPHSPACWGCGVKKKDWQAAATRAGNAILKINPKVLIIVEGIEDIKAAYKTTWGGALGAVAKKPVKLKVKNHVVYSPHDYPPSVHAQKFYKSASWVKKIAKAWTANWGYIVDKKIAPVMLGEFGSKFATSADKKWMSLMVSYLKKKKISFGYWTFNANSTSTGGLVTDNWVTYDSVKLKALKPLLGSPTSVPLQVPLPSFTANLPTGPIPDGLAATWVPLVAWSGGYAAQISISSSTQINNWTLVIPDANATSMVADATAPWGMTCSLVPRVAITCSGSGYGQTIGAGKRLVVGLVVYSGLAPKSPALAISGS